MALATPDMSSCEPKRRCLNGPNAGLAYTPGSECPQGYDWNEALCDCEAGWTSMDYKIQGVQTNIRYCCNATPTEGCTSCDGSIVPGYPQDVPGTVQEESIIITRAEWDARYSLGVNNNSPCNTYEEFATLASAKTWRGPGIRWISNDGLTSGCGLSDPADAFACVGRCDGNLSASYVNGQEVIVYSYS